MFNELRITVIAPFGFETIEHTHQPETDSQIICPASLVGPANTSD
jgi:hypothetical protein